MSLLAALRRFRAALAHWGPSQYLFLAALWFTVSLPFIWSDWGWASALSLPLMLLAIVGITAALNAFASGRPRKPVAPRPGFPPDLDHPELGRFPLSPFSAERYVRTFDWCGAPVALYLEPRQADSIPELLRVASELMAASESVDAQVRAAVARAMLDAYNGEWRAAPQPRLTAEAFLNTLMLETIVIQPDRSYAFLYQDGGLFDGHWIQVSGTLAQGPLDVELQG